MENLSDRPAWPEAGTEAPKRHRVPLENGRGRVPECLAKPPEGDDATGGQAEPNGPRMRTAPRTPFSPALLLVLFLAVPVALGQEFAANLGDVYLPMLAEKVECGSERLVDFGFGEREVELLESFVIPAESPGRLGRSCFLFRDVRGAEARGVVAKIMHEFADHGYWHGIPRDYSGLQLVQSEDDRSLVAFSFLNEEILMGPDAGVAGFDLDHENGLVMYLWALYLPKH